METDAALTLRIVYDDPPDLVEVEAVVSYRGWAAQVASLRQPRQYCECCGASPRLVARARGFVPT